MTQTLPSLTTEAAALSVAGTGLRRYLMGSTLIGAGVDATVVIVASGDNPGVSGVQDSTRVLLRGDAIPALHARFDLGEGLPLHLFARLDRGCLPLGTARCRGSSAPAAFDHAELELDQPLTREMLDAVRPVPPPGPVPGVDWVDEVEADPIRALESFVLGWFPAEKTEPAGRESTACEPDDLPEALAAFHHLARLRPAVYHFRNSVLKQPRRTSGPLGGRLVFAVDGEGTRDWSIPWPPQELGEVDPRVWLTEDPTPTVRLAPLWSMLRPVPVSPFLPTYTAEKFYVAPGLLTRISSDENEAVVAFAALHRATLTPLLEHEFRWSRFDG